MQHHVTQVKRGYRLKQASTSFETRTPIAKQRGPANCPRRPEAPVRDGDVALPAGPTMTDVAHIIAEAETKSFLASTAAEEVERIFRLAEESDSLLMLASEVLEQCKAQSPRPPSKYFSSFPVCANFLTWTPPPQVHKEKP